MIDFAPHNMTSNTAPFPYVASASTEYSSTFKAWTAFDNGYSNNQYWLATTSTGYVQIDVGGIYRLDNYTVRVNTIPEPNRAPKAWTMQVSRYGTDWTIVDTVTDQTAWSSGEGRNFTCDNRIMFGRYFKINITENNGDGLVQLAELYLNGDIFTGITTYLKERRHSRIDLGAISHL